MTKLARRTTCAGRWARRLLGLALICFALLSLLIIAIRLLWPLPSLDGRPVSTALTDTGDTPLGTATAAGIAAHPGRSGIHLLASGEDAFAARVALARSATRSLDLQYYIWKLDLSGTLLLDELRIAADRGVRVRLLLDDNVTAGLDPVLAALDGHPNIEIRLFNPFVIRKFRLLGYLTDFPRLNRRMHNKSFTADNQATIVGGRNIGDEYMGAGDVLFADLDVLTVGPAVREVSRQFDRYWASRSAYPADRILARPGAQHLERLTADAAEIRKRPEGKRYVQAILASPLAARLRNRTVEFDWVKTRLVSDDPAKGLGLAADEDLLFPSLVNIVGKPHSSLSLISSYFVPTAVGAESIAAMAQRGVQVSILTNALEATDVPIVHAGYLPWRKSMLAAGVRLYELRRTGERMPGGRKLRGSGSGSGDGTAVGGSATALHAKTFAIDGEHVFVGSFNFDPRSARLNTELGLVMESRTISRAVETAFDDGIPARAYEVKLGADGRLYWLEQRGEHVVRHDSEPGASRITRLLIGFLALLPIDWLL